MSQPWKPGGAGEEGSAESSQLGGGRAKSVRMRRRVSAEGLV